MLQWRSKYGWKSGGLREYNAGVDGARELGTMLARV
jgi:hypothetical protein